MVSFPCDLLSLLRKGGWMIRRSNQCRWYSCRKAKRGKAEGRKEHGAGYRERERAWRGEESWLDSCLRTNESTVMWGSRIEWCTCTRHIHYSHCPFTTLWLLCTEHRVLSFYDLFLFSFVSSPLSDTVVIVYCIVQNKWLRPLWPIRD